MKLFFILLLTYVEIFCIDEEEWTNYKVKFNKTYKNIDEDNYRFGIFKNNSKEIKKHNKAFEDGLVTYQKEINKFADLTADEFTIKYKMPKRLTVTHNESDSEENVISNEDTEHDFFDWRQLGAVTEVKDQGECGACWIFSAIAVLEGYYFRKYNKLVSLSSQNMVDCISNKTCDGGWPPIAIDYIKKHGINLESDYPYEGKEGKCRYNQSRDLNITFNNMKCLENLNETELKKTILNYGPVLGAIYVSHDWMFYRKGVWYEPECSYFPNHAVVIVGYGTHNGIDYWLIKNSLGKDWGENGYIKFPRNKHRNYCGLSFISCIIK